MSEYWKSTPKYWCKHCSLYVKDVPFERKQHEATGKHQGNLKRSLRNIQNDHERNEREKLRAKAEVERLNRVVGGGSTSSTIPPPSAPSIRTPASSALSGADQKRQWAQLAGMGIQVPDTYKAEMAMPGDWKVVSRHQDNNPLSEDSLSTGVRKRKFEGQEEEEEAEPTVVKKGWGSTTKHYPGQHTNDLDILLSNNITIKGKLPPKQEDAENIKRESSKEVMAEGGTEGRPEPPSVQTTEVEMPAGKNDILGQTSEQHSDDRPVSVKNEDLQTEAEKPPLKNIPTAQLTEAIIPVFKKRKAKVKVT